MHEVIEGGGTLTRPIVHGLTHLADLLATVTLTAAVTPGIASTRATDQPGPRPPAAWLPGVMPTVAFRPAVVRDGRVWSRRSLGRLGVGVVLVALVGLALLLGWRLRQEAQERRVLEGQLLAATVEAARAPVLARALATADAVLVEQAGRLADLADALDARRQEVATLSARLLGERARVSDLRRALAEQHEHGVAQATAAAAERAHLLEELDRREALLADLVARVDGLQQRVDAAEALTRRVLQALGLVPVRGPAGGDGEPLKAATSPAADRPPAARIEELAARVSALTRDLAAAERLRGLRQASAQPRLTAAEAAAAPVGRPVAGPISSGFGPRVSPIDRELRHHGGVDIVASVGTPIRATQAGEVTLAGQRDDHGLTVVLRHAAGFETVYGHASRLLVATGQRVEAGQVIALVGNTGVSTGPHLHYEVWLRGQALDPAPLLTLSR